MPDISGMRNGKKYRVIFRSYEDGRSAGTKALVGVYMGQDYAEDLLFSLRPVAGTTAIRKDQFIGAAIVPGHFDSRVPFTWTEGK